MIGNNSDANILEPDRWLVGDNYTLVASSNYKTCTIEEALMYLTCLDEIQLDVETQGFDPYTCDLLCIQLGDKTGENQFLFPTASQENRKIVIDKLKPLLERKDKVFLLQNAQFDLKFFRLHGVIISSVYDTFLAECVLTTGYSDDPTNEYYRETALDSIVFKYTGAKLNKSIRSAINREGFTDRVIVYACEDVRYLSKVKEEQLKLIKEYELEETLNLENKAVVAFSAMCFNGIKVDSDKWKEVAAKIDKMLSEQEHILDDIVMNDPKLVSFRPKTTQMALFTFGDERKVSVNWGSPKQKLNILQTLLGKDIESTGDRILQKNKKKHKLVKELISFNKLNKLESSFGKKFLKFINPVTKRVHAEVWQILSTGRISVSEPNLNQIPAKGDLGVLIRSCFIAEEGYSIVGGDYSGMELRIIAEFSQDPVWVNAFKEGKDLHSVLCAKTFDIPETDVKKPFYLKPEMTFRDVQKIINFGLAYGMSEFKLSDTMDIVVKKAKDIIDKFFKMVPRVKAMLDMFGNLAKKHGRIRTAPPFRRIRWFPEHEFVVATNDFTKLGEIERAGKNTPIQGTNGDIIKLAISRLQTIIDDNKLDIKIILSVYDELRTECPDELAEWWKGVMEKTMIDAAKVVIKTVPIVVDCTIKKCWEK